MSSRQLKVIDASTSTPRTKSVSCAASFNRDALRDRHANRAFSQRPQRRGCDVGGLPERRGLLSHRGLPRPWCAGRNTWGGERAGKRIAPAPEAVTHG
jgi:hypothetical protein